MGAYIDRSVLLCEPKAPVLENPTSNVNSMRMRYKHGLVPGPALKEHKSTDKTGMRILYVVSLMLSAVQE